MSDNFEQAYLLERNTVTARLHCNKRRPVEKTRPVAIQNESFRVQHGVFQRQCIVTMRSRDPVSNPGYVVYSIYGVITL